jgi:hypothetical protein
MRVRWLRKALRNLDDEATYLIFRRSLNAFARNFPVAGGLR